MPDLEFYNRQRLTLGYRQRTHGQGFSSIGL